MMQRALILLTILATCAACERSMANLPKWSIPDDEYEVVILGNHEHARYDVTFTSFSRRDMCLHVDQLPNSIGQLSFATDTVFVISNSKRHYYAEPRNFGYCVGEKCILRVEPGGQVSGFVKFSEFPSEAFANTLEVPRLVYKIIPSRCESHRR